MESPHKAEKVKIGIEAIVNKFRFKKSNVTNNLTDQGSNMLKLHSPIDNTIEVNNTLVNVLVDLDSDSDNESIDDEEDEFDAVIDFNREQKKAML